MNIYKYSINIEKIICITECPIIEETTSQYIIQEPKKKNRISKDCIDVFENKVLYSFSDDKKTDYVEMIKGHYNRVSEDYLKKSEDAKKSLAEILKINNLN